MPLTSDVNDLIAKTPTGQGECLLVMVDHKDQANAYGLYLGSQFNTVQLDGVHELFDEALLTLSNPSKTYYTADELPILTQVGPHEVTVVERASDGTVSVRSGRTEPVENHMGIGG
jgi:hypothetical protein